MVKDICIYPYPPPHYMEKENKVGEGLGVGAYLLLSCYTWDLPWQASTGSVEIFLPCRPTNNQFSGQHNLLQGCIWCINQLHQNLHGTLGLLLNGLADGS